jgi:hypothetical protein
LYKNTIMNIQTFQIRIENNVLQLNNLTKFIGKDVIISIIEIPKIPEKKNKKKWNYIGTAYLNKQLDDNNIRDFAHE